VKTQDITSTGDKYRKDNYNMDWLKKILSGEKQVEEEAPPPLNTKELFPLLSLEEKRRVLDLNEFYLQSTLSARRGRVNVVDAGMNSEFVDRMTDQEIMEAIELARLSREATDATDHRKAIRIFEQIVAKAPFDSISMMSIGVHYAGLGDGRKAVSYLEKALRSDPNNQRIRENLEGIRQYFGL
jgi:tetratricopeptide (TPR) repeat protein